MSKTFLGRTSLSIVFWFATVKLAFAKANPASFVYTSRVHYCKEPLHRIEDVHRCEVTLCRCEVTLRRENKGPNFNILLGSPLRSNPSLRRITIKLLVFPQVRRNEGLFTVAKPLWTFKFHPFVIGESPFTVAKTTILRHTKRNGKFFFFFLFTSSSGFSLSQNW